jgi:arylsulfatase A-like enzyme
MGIVKSCDPQVTKRSDNLCTAIATNANYVRQLRLAYYAVVSLTDAAFGRVLDKLESTGLADSTIVTFIGDHGYQNGEKGEWCKSNNFVSTSEHNSFCRSSPLLVRILSFLAWNLIARSSPCAFRCMFLRRGVLHGEGPGMLEAA